MPFKSPNEALGVRKPSLAAIPHKTRKQKVLKAPGAGLTSKPPFKPPIAPSIQGLKMAALGGKPFAPGSEGF